MKVKKRNKRSRIRGRKTIGYGARKKHKKSGHKGGKGMSGTGKRADQKKTLVLKLYGNNYFGKQGVTSRGTQKRKRKEISLDTIYLNLDNFVNKGIAKKTKDGFELDLKDYRVLGSNGKIKIKEKLIINAKTASQTAIESIKKIGGEIRV